MKTITLSILSLLCFVSSVFGQSKPTAKEPPKTKLLPIVFDEWWNVDYVKNGCEMASQNGRPCPLARTPADVVREFEDELEVVFASENECHGLSLVHFTPAMAQAAVKNPNAPATGSMATMAGPSWSLM